MAGSRVYNTAFYTFLLALLLLGCAFILLCLFMAMIFATDPGMDANVMAIEITLAALGITIIYTVLYFIYRWCFFVFATPGGTQAEFLRSWPGTIFVAIFVAVSIMMCYVPLCLAFTSFDHPVPYRFIAGLLRLGTILELIVIGWAAQYVVRVWYYAHPSEKYVAATSGK